MDLGTEAGNFGLFWEVFDPSGGNTTGAFCAIAQPCQTPCHRSDRVCVIAEVDGKQDAITVALAVEETPEGCLEGMDDVTRGVNVRTGELGKLGQTGKNGVVYLEFG